MHEMLQEFTDLRGVDVRVDRKRAVLRGVKILGRTSRNGRTYPSEAVAAAAALYEGAKVNVNHPKGSPASPRDYHDRIGVLRDVAVRENGELFADFHFNPKHVLAEQLLWDAEHSPESVGFSHNVEARTSRTSGAVVVEEILRVQSVDLVADPATTNGLFESAESGANAAVVAKRADAGNGNGDDGNRGNHADNAAVAAADERGVVATVASDPSSGSSSVAAAWESLRAARPDLAAVLTEAFSQERLQRDAELERLQAALAVHEKQALVRRLLTEYRLPDPESAQGWGKALVGPSFRASLAAAEDEATMRVLLEERAALVRGADAAIRAVGERARPLSRDRLAVENDVPRDAKAFAASIT